MTNDLNPIVLAVMLLIVAFGVGLLIVQLTDRRRPEAFRTSAIAAALTGVAVSIAWAHALPTLWLVALSVVDCLACALPVAIACEVTGRRARLLLANGAEMQEFLEAILQALPSGSKLVRQKDIELALSISRQVHRLSRWDRLRVMLGLAPKRDRNQLALLLIRQNFEEIGHAEFWFKQPLPPYPRVGVTPNSMPPGPFEVDLPEYVISSDDIANLKTRLIDRFGAWRSGS